MHIHTHSHTHTNSLIDETISHEHDLNTISLHTLRCCVARALTSAPPAALPPPATCSTCDPRERERERARTRSLCNTESARVRESTPEERDCEIESSADLFLGYNNAARAGAHNFGIISTLCVDFGGKSRKFFRAAASRPHRGNANKAAKNKSCVLCWSK